MSKGRQPKADPAVRLEHRVRALKQELAKLDKILQGDERWKALAALDQHPERDDIPALAARARLERALDGDAVYKARSKLAEAIALLSDPHAPAAPQKAAEPVQQPQREALTRESKAVEPVFLTPTKSVGWYRSLTQSIAELGDGVPKPAPSQGVTPDVEASGLSPVPRSLEVEEAEVWIVDRSGPGPGAARSLSAVADAPEDAAGIDGLRYAGYQDAVEEATVEIVHPRPDDGGGRKAR